MNISAQLFDGTGSTNPQGLGFRMIEGGWMKSFLMMLVVGVALLQVCHAAPKRVWQCTRCKATYSGTNLPRFKKCPQTNLQQFHVWQELALGFTTDVAADRPLHDASTADGDSGGAALGVPTGVSRDSPQVGNNAAEDSRTVSARREPN